MRFPFFRNRDSVKNGILISIRRTGDGFHPGLFTKNMASERTEELYRVLLSKGYPKELCAEIAYKNMNTDYTATRMLGYLYRYTNPKIEDLVDEMLAILSDRAQIIEKKESEHAQAVISEMYRKGL